MDDLSRYFYEQEYKVHFLTAKGDAFQDFFSTIMEKRYPADFQRMRPWGKIGDRKNDGYLKSTRFLFQVYAPNEMSASEACAKIDEDFKGALPYWKDFFETWCFVHNSFQGLGPLVQAKLLEMEKNHTPIKVRNWGYEEIRLEVIKLDEERLRSIFGSVPSRKNFRDLRFNDIQQVLQTIEHKIPYDTSDPIRPVPNGKLEANQLSAASKALIATGMTCSDRVKDFFERWHDPTLGDKVAQMFYSKYIELRDSKMVPDLIFTQLQTFAGLEVDSLPNRQVAILALLAFFFEQCDIFERPRTEAS